MQGPGFAEGLAHFNAFASTHRADDYCEGNAWQYTWLAPHDVKGLGRAVRLVRR